MVPLFYLRFEKGGEPIYMQMSGGHLQAPVQKLVPAIIFVNGENAYRLPYPAPKSSRIHVDPGAFSYANTEHATPAPQ